MEERLERRWQRVWESNSEALSSPLAPAAPPTPPRNSSPSTCQEKANSDSAKCPLDTRTELIPRPGVKEFGPVVHTWNPSSGERKARGS